MSCAPRVPNQVSAGTSRQTSDYSWHLGFLGSLVNSMVPPADPSLISRNVAHPVCQLGYFSIKIPDRNMVYAAHFLKAHA